MKSGPIVLVDDDVDDRDILQEILQDLQVPNKLMWFPTSNDAFIYLKNSTVQPFLIFCDLNLPFQSGLEFKKKIDADKDLRRKSIPFIFYSTSVQPTAVEVAYTQMTVQGFFQKKAIYEDLKKLVSIILAYWENCSHPNAI